MNTINNASENKYPFLGWLKRLAALQAAHLVAGCDQPAERAHP